ncbi:class I SAM-dependent methyltransferase [Mycobacterium sp. PDNC021]|uniref:class I SAM-dependent methyltransferase n=1 Tax=Mycobacterium sp. PDNC021 TaxID=3391399 RepID=UPI003AAD6E52
MDSSDPPRSPADGLFAGTAWHYARYRPGYPAVLIADLVQCLGLDGTGRLLDLGCGTGQLTLPLAAHVAEAVGIDPEPEMLHESARLGREQAVANVSWVQGNSSDLPGELGHFSLVTMGRSFHWMDRQQVLAALDERVDEDGTLVIANDSNLILPSTPWQRAIQDIQRRFMPKAYQYAKPTAPDTLQTHEQVLASSAFRRVNRQVYEFKRSWTIEQAIGYFYSTSLPLRRLLGDRQAAFEDTVTETLLAVEPSGRFIEPVALEVLTATRTREAIPK